LVSLLTQAGGIKLLERLVPVKEKLLIYLFVLSAILLFALTFANTLTLFTIFIILFMFPNSGATPILSGLISENAPDKEQGKILGINQSFISFGQIIGPIMAGVVANYYVPGIFMLSSILMIVALFVAVRKIVPVATSR